jgi:hypothetical protein
VLALSQKIRELGIEVAKLNLSNNRITLNGLSLILEKLDRVQYLREVVLDSNMMTGDNMGFMAVFLAGNTFI